MIDIHTHFLPGLDDGPQSFEESLEMVRVALKDGITHVVLTPHVREGKWENPPEKIAAQARRLREHCAAHGLELEFSVGGELSLREDLPERLRLGQAPTLNGHGKYVLVELPFGGFPVGTYDLLFQLQTKGFRVILAHPERYLEFREEPSQLYRLCLSGILCQVTAHSLLGSYGSEVEKSARFILRHRWAQFLASDSHAPSERPPVLSTGVAAAARLIGQEEAWRMVTEHPKQAVEGKPVRFHPLELKPRRSLWSFLGIRRQPRSLL